MGGTSSGWTSSGLTSSALLLDVICNASSAPRRRSGLQRVPSSPGPHSPWMKNRETSLLSHPRSRWGDQGMEQESGSQVSHCC